MRCHAQMKGKFLICFGLCLVGVMFVTAAVPSEVARPSAEERLGPIFRIENEKGAETYQTFSKRENIESQIIAFRAIVSRRWPSGMVPIFLVKKKQGIALQRFPPGGQEGLIEPLFFGLLPQGEETNRDLLGRWECIAIHDDGAKEYFSWDFTLQGSDLVGRFDIDTDFRFASIMKGRFLKNQIRLDVQYIEASYHLEGLIERGNLKGDWSRTDEEGEGTWEAHRPEMPPRLPKAGLCHLWAFNKEGHSEVYRVEGHSIGSDWVRGDQPICQVWR